MAKLGITMDGRTYKVWIIYDSLERGFEFVEGSNSDVSISGADILDTLGTKYSYQMRVVPDPAHKSDYDDFFYAISDPSRIHTITMPFGQSSITFQCRVNNGGDVFKGNEGAAKLWTGLSVSFTPIKPQR